jgi:hypothetical protein
LVWCLVTGLFRSRTTLQAEILILRHQVNVLRRKSPRNLLASAVDSSLNAGSSLVNISNRVGSRPFPLVLAGHCHRVLAGQPKAVGRFLAARTKKSLVARRSGNKGQFSEVQRELFKMTYRSSNPPTPARQFDL